MVRSIANKSTPLPFSVLQITETLYNLIRETILLLLPTTIGQVYQKELDTRYDKHERLVKLSRDCTIHSKRVIFLLHRVTATGNATGEESNSVVFTAAETKLQEVLSIIKQMAVELSREDPYRFHSAYTIGIEEFIEALSYFVFLKEGRLVSLEEVQQQLTFPQTACDPKMEVDDSSEKEEEKETSVEKEGDQMDWTALPSPVLVFPLSLISFVLGVADLTGELMRLSINAVGSGNRELPFTVLRFIREIYCSFLRLWPASSKQLPKKIEIMKTSLVKIEQVCYTIRVRGSEMSQHMLADIVNSSSDHTAT